MPSQSSLVSICEVPELIVLLGMGGCGELVDISWQAHYLALPDTIERNTIGMAVLDLRCISCFWSRYLYPLILR